MDLFGPWDVCDHLPIDVREFTAPGRLECTVCGAVLAEPKAERVTKEIDEAA